MSVFDDHFEAYMGWDQDEPIGGLAVRGELVHQTKKAYLVALWPDSREVWLPKSRVDTFNEDGKTFFAVPMWLADDKGLEGNPYP